MKGTLDTDEMRVARIEIDFLISPVKFNATFAFVCSRTGATPAFARAEGGIWTTGTLEKLRELCEAMELDMSKAVLTGGSSAPAKAGLKIEGLGEHLGTTEAPSV